MTAFTLQAPMPTAILPGGSTIELEAISPTTGASVGGVSATNFTVYGYDVSASTTALEDVVPLYTPEQVVGTPA